MIDIKIPYTTKPTMVKNTGSTFTPITPYYYSEKIKELNLLGDQLYGTSAVGHRLIPKISQHLGKNNINDIRDLALEINEDIAVLHNGKLESLCFCFPSSWIPKEKLGLSLTQIHQPVADNDHLVKYSDRLAHTISDPVLGSFRRQVWTLTTNPNLSAHPGYNKPIANTLEDLYFRLETQTTDPVGDGLTSLFFVKVEVFPLKDIWNEYGNKIKASIASMTDTVLDYKNLRQIKSLLV
jgi:hypothetical protein